MTSKTQNSTLVPKFPKSWHFLALDPLNDIVDKIKSFLDVKSGVRFSGCCGSLWDIRRDSRNLDFSHSKITFEAFQQFILNAPIDPKTGFRKIDSINLSGCAQVTDEWLELIGAHCLGLKKINLRFAKGVKDKGLKHLENCQRLEEFNIGNNGSHDSLGRKNPEFTPYGLRELLIQLPNLKVFVAHDCWQLNDGCVAVLGTCKKLREILFSGLYISDAGLANLKGLTKVNIEFPRETTAAGIQKLIENCPGLQFFRLFGAPAPINEQGVRALANTCKGLRELRFLNCREVTSGALTEVLQQNQQLHSLELYGETPVQSAWLGSIAPHCPHLRLLRLDDVSDKLSKESCQAFLKVNPMVTIQFNLSSRVFRMESNEKIKAMKEELESAKGYNLTKEYLSQYYHMLGRQREREWAYELGRYDRGFLPDAMVEEPRKWQLALKEVRKQKTGKLLEAPKTEHKAEAFKKLEDEKKDDDESEEAIISRMQQVERQLAALKALRDKLRMQATAEALREENKDSQPSSSTAVSSDALTSETLREEYKDPLPVVEVEQEADLPLQTNTTCDQLTSLLYRDELKVIGVAALAGIFGTGAGALGLALWGGYSLAKRCRRV